MKTDQAVILTQIDHVLARYNELRSRSRNADLSDLRRDQLSEVLTLMFTAIERLAPPGSRYVENARAYNKVLGGFLGNALSPLAGILQALRADYEAGYLQSVAELIHADLFSDFLEMAYYLLEQGYKDPCAVIAGTVLEGHLRKLCEKNGLPIDQNNKPKKADTLNSDLAAANVYSKLDQKSITAWLDLRNKAAHGKYDEYKREQVVLLVQSIRDFISRHPA